MDPREKKKRVAQIAAVVIVLLVIGGLALLFLGGNDEPEAASTLGPSDSMVPADPASVDVNAAGQLVALPAAVVLNAQATSQIVSIMASGVPIRIEDVRIPSEYAQDLQVASIDCPAATQPLGANATCSASVTWSGKRPLSTTIEVKGATAVGESKPVDLLIPVSAEGAVVDTSGIPAQPDATLPQPVGGSPVGYGAPQTVAAAVQEAGPSLQQQRRDAYMQARQGGQLAPIQGSRLQASAKSPYTSWNTIGAAGSVSSRPTDMSRVITPDKAITAVIASPIDTRMAVTAVAMVDRDIYGNNGRTVVIPRGSKLIGQVGAGAGRIGIAWSQLIRPDGVRFMFEASSGDAMGRGGVPGRMNEQLLRRYGYSLIPSAVAAGITAGLGGKSSTTAGTTGTIESQDARSVAADILSQPLNQIAQDIYQRNSQVPIQTTVPVGTRITVWSVGDMRLKPVGERDDEEDQGQSQAARSGKGVQLPTAQASNRMTSQGQRQGTSSGDGRAEGAIAQGNYPVGTIDENGNYIAPGMNAPTPSQAPLPTSTVSKSAAGKTTFPATSNPWQN